MKRCRRVPALALCALVFALSLSACGAKKAEVKTGGKTKVVLNEVAHSIFYAPMYVAIEEGYFEEKGIELELVTGLGADN